MSSYPACSTGIQENGFDERPPRYIFPPRLSLSLSLSWRNLTQFRLIRSRPAFVRLYVRVCVQLLRSRKRRFRQIWKIPRTLAVPWLKHDPKSKWIVYPRRMEKKEEKRRRRKLRAYAVKDNEWQVGWNGFAALLHRLFFLPIFLFFSLRVFYEWKMI